MGRSATHLYYGDYPQLGVFFVTAYCGWRNVPFQKTTTDWKLATCANCLGKRGGALLAPIALAQMEEERKA